MSNESSNGHSNGKPETGESVPRTKRPYRKKKRGGWKLTTEFIHKVEKLAAHGMTQRQIATIMGVGECTISSWKSKKGFLEEKFAKAIARGEATGIQRRLERIEKAGKKGSWQADAWLLERRVPEQFGRNDRMKVTDGEGRPIAGTTVIAPSVVFIQPKEDAIDNVIDLKQVGNGTNGNGEAQH